MRVLITGITGLIGSHLAKYLLEIDEENIEIWGFKRWRSNEENIARLQGRVMFLEGDIQDYSSVRNALARSKPDWVFHLAAQSYPKESMDAPHITFRINVEGTVNLLEAIKDLKLDPKIHIASSSAVYGFVSPKEIPISEDHPLRPLTPYGISKVAQEHLGYEYSKNYRLRICTTRFFNQAGPGQNERCAVQTFAKQIAMIEAGRQKPVICVGNLEPKRDYTDVRDTAKALWLLMKRGRVGEIYNMGSGRSISIRDLLDLILKRSTVEVEIKVDEERLRPSDEPILEGDIAKLRRDVGWESDYSIEDMIDSILEYWRKKVAKDH